MGPIQKIIINIDLKDIK